MDVRKQISDEFLINPPEDSQHVSWCLGLMCDKLGVCLPRHVSPDCACMSRGIYCHCYANKTGYN